MNYKILCSVKEARHKRLHIILFHLYEIPIKSIYIETESIFVFAKEWGREVMKTDT